VQKAPAEALPFPVLLACGFTPLHLQNYLAAYLQTAMPGRKVRLATGLYDDVAGTLELLSEKPAQSAALALEWPDLDPRLGYRQLGGWGQRVVPSVVESVEAKLSRIEAAIRSLPPSAKLAVSLPTLPLPPAFHTTGWQASRAEIILAESIAKFARHIAEHPAVLVVNEQALANVSPPATRYDFRSDLHAGFPYTMAHADALGAALAALIKAPEPKKGLITDLDDTLWLGLVGEAGHENVSWDLTNHSQLHGLYQQMLHALTDQGVLIAIASKNSPEEVERALARSDLAIARDKIFPIEVHWEPKSGSVGRILKTWNIGADSVVFVDDSPMELEEVREAHPGIECIQFPKSDYAGGLALLRRLRDLFGKSELSEEDSFRLESIRQNQQLVSANGTAGSAEHFLSEAQATVTLEYDPAPSDRRVVELVNKTNQFNLNGLRYTEGEWQQFVREPESFAVAVSYQDKFGPLGKIAVLRGMHTGSSLHVGAWVMSCRAFSRRIEHQCLAKLFERFGVEEMIFDFQPTRKNGPLQEFLSGMLGHPATPEARLRRDRFEAQCPKLYHEIVEIDGGVKTTGESACTTVEIDG
jgi:FkbH-like protein